MRESRIKKAAVTILLVTLMSLYACAPAAEKEKKVEFNIETLLGPTGMGMVVMMEENEKGNLNGGEYKFECLEAPLPDVAAPEGHNIATVPANMAAALYNNSEGKVVVLAINTGSVLYIVDTDNSVSSFEDLQNKTIYSAGKGASPEVVLKYLAGRAGLDYASLRIEWKSEHAECLQALNANPGSVALLPQPFVTVAQSKNEKIRIAIDLGKEWEKTDNNASLITGVVVGNREFVESNPKAIEEFMAGYRKSVEYINSNEEAPRLIEKWLNIPENVASKALPYCNIIFIEGEKMQEELEAYLGVLYKENPEMIGGKLPLEDFYYKGN